jgi:hypothetical protein
MIIHTFHRRSSLRFTSFHFTVLHYISHPIFFISLHFWGFRHHPSKTLHFSLLVITFLILYLKICDCASVGSRFHSLTVLFTKEYLPISVLCFLALILRSRLSLFRWHGPFNMFPIDFHARSPVYASNRAQIRAISLRFAKVSKNRSYDLQI